MVAGGRLNVRRVAETLANKITEFTAAQGFSANIVTALLVIFASKLRMPVSTTHISVGSLIGIGCITGNCRAGMIAEILLSWIITLPLALTLSAAIYWISAY